MRAILVAIAWAGAGSSPSVTAPTLTDLALSLALTAVVAWFAHENERRKARRRESELLRAVPVAGIH